MPYQPPPPGAGSLPPAACSALPSLQPVFKRQLAMTVVNPWYQLGYVIPHLYTDMDAYQFYRIAPEGMMLVTTGLDLPDYTLAGVERELPMFRERVELLANGKVSPELRLLIEVI